VFHETPRNIAITPRERFCRLYDFERVDSLVRWEAVGFWGETAEEWRKDGGLPQDVDPMDYYRMDPRPGISGNLGFTSMALSGPKPQTHLVADEGRTRVYRNDLGQEWRDRVGGVSMPQWLRFPVESGLDWERIIKPRLEPQNHDYGNLEAEAVQSHASDDPYGMWIIGLYAFWRNLWGEEKLALAFYDYPEVLHDMARCWLRMHCECTPRILETARIDYVMFHEDMAFRNGPLIGPKLFDAFMTPYYRELFAHLRNRGQHRFMLDSDGNNGMVLDRFVDLGMNGLYPFEVAASCDAVAFRETHPRFFVWGAIDKRVLLGTKDDVEREVMAKVPVLWESGGFIPSIDHSVPPCRQENFEHFLQLVRAICR
jgi:uroporphyrinogen decarboxylase